MIRISFKKILPFGFFSFLVFIILGPLLLRGYVFLLDYSLTVLLNFYFDDYLNGHKIISALPFDLLTYLFGKIFLVDIAQKIILFCSLFIIPVGLWFGLSKKIDLLPRLIACTFFLVNPFVYERFMAGHIGVLFGYAFLPIVLSLICKVFEEKSTKSIINAAIVWAVQVAFLGLHFLIIDAVILFLFFLVKIIINLNLGKVKSDILIMIKLFVAILIFNIWWIIPMLLLSSNPVSSFGGDHFNAYTSAADEKFGKFINLAGMYGFWREGTSGKEILLTKDYLIEWPIFLLIFLVPIILGVYYLWKQKRYAYVISLFLMATFAIIFSYGPVNNWWGSINRYIFINVPGFKGLRESQKFSSLLVLVYAIFMAYGLNYLKVKTKWLYILVSLLVFLNIFYFNHKFIWGMNNQVKAVNYPASFYEIKSILDQDKSENKTLILPWQSYLIRHPLAQGRTIFDIAQNFFRPNNLIASSNENMGYEKSDNRAMDVRINFLLLSTDPEKWHGFLKSMGIKYIFITKLKDNFKYGFDYNFLLNSLKFEKIKEDNMVILFRLK